MGAIHHTRQYQACVTEMKARGRYQMCITAGSTANCPGLLDATVRKGHRQHMTLGHHIDVDVAPELAYVPSNYGPQCGPCNYAGGAHRTNAKRRGESGRELRTSPDWT